MKQTEPGDLSAVIAKAVSAALRCAQYVWAAGLFSCLFLCCDSTIALVTVLVIPPIPQSPLSTCVQCCTKQKLIAAEP